MDMMANMAESNSTDSLLKWKRKLKGTIGCSSTTSKMLVVKRKKKLSVGAYLIGDGSSKPSRRTRFLGPTLNLSVEAKSQPRWES